MFRINPKTPGNIKRSLFAVMQNTKHRRVSWTSASSFTRIRICLEEHELVSIGRLCVCSWNNYVYYIREDMNIVCVLCEHGVWVWRMHMNKHTYSVHAAQFHSGENDHRVSTHMHTWSKHKRNEYTRGHMHTFHEQLRKQLNINHVIREEQKQPNL